MENPFDIIVLGSGLGGLAAAFESLRAGKRVLLLEQHNLPGGFATSFVRGRFEFEPALHEMPDMRSVEAITGVAGYLKENAGLDIDFLPVPEAYRVILTEKGVNVRLPFGVEDFINTIEEKVPGSRESLTRYMELCREVQDAFQFLSQNQEKPDYSQVMKKYGNFIRTGSVTAERVAEELKIPEKACELLYPYWCYLGVPINRVSFSIWAALLDSYIRNPAVIPRLRSHEISSAFLDKIYEQGGEVRFNTKVSRILAENGCIKGVETASGERISCHQLICNVSPTTVFNKLISPREDVPPDAFRNVRSRKYGFSMLVIYLGLDASMEELGLKDYSYFIAPHMDTEKLYDAVFDLESENMMQASICLNAANPDCSPPGTTILSITLGFSSDAWEKNSAKDYFRTKDRLAKRMIKQFEEATGTDIFSHIEEIEIAAPATFARYTDAWNGHVYGYAPEPWDGIVPRVLSLEKELYFRGLDFCGGNSFRSYGYGSSIMSGKGAAERVIRRMEKQS